MTHPFFVFFFYKVENPWGGGDVLSRGLRAESDPDGRYGRYFLSLWFEMPDCVRTQEVREQLDGLERRQVSEVYFAGDEWDIGVSLEGVTFTHHQFDDWNDGVQNVFDYHEFKSVFMAWDHFLSIPPEPPGSEYYFEIPRDAFSLSAIGAQLIRKD